MEKKLYNDPDFQACANDLVGMRTEGRTEYQCGKFYVVAYSDPVKGPSQASVYIVDPVKPFEGEPMFAIASLRFTPDGKISGDERGCRTCYANDDFRRALEDAGFESE